MALWGLLGLNGPRPGVGATRSIASDCSSLVQSIIQHTPPQKSTPDLLHYRFKNSIWREILSVKDFENFNEIEYFRLLEIYKDKGVTQKNLMSLNPTTIEQKLALIEAIQSKYNYFLKTPTVREEIENLNAFKLKKLERLMRNFDLSSKISRNHLEEFSSDFFLLLKGPPISLLDYFTKNKTRRMNERMFRVLEEDLLIRGLSGTLERIPEKTTYKSSEEAKSYLKNIMNYKVWRYLVLPYDLPWVDQVKISDELLEKILLDGLSKHESELISELKRQNLIDHYERFRKVYRPVAFGVGFYYYYQKYQNELAAEEAGNNDELKKKFVKDFQKLSDTINAGETSFESEQALKEIQFQRVLKNYKDRYQADPTPAEYQELRQKIFGDVIERQI